MYFSLSIYADIFWTVIPRLILIFIAIPSLLVSFILSSEPEIIYIQASANGCDLIYGNSAVRCGGIDLVELYRILFRPKDQPPVISNKKFSPMSPGRLRYSNFFKFIECSSHLVNSKIEVRLISIPGTPNYLDLKFNETGMPYRVRVSKCVVKFLDLYLFLWKLYFILNIL